MRRRLLAAQPALAQWFHIRPWEISLLTDEELANMLDTISKNKPAAAASPKGGDWRKFGH